MFILVSYWLNKIYQFTNRFLIWQVYELFDLHAIISLISVDCSFIAWFFTFKMSGEYLQDWAALEFPTLKPSVLTHFSTFV